MDYVCVYCDYLCHCRNIHTSYRGNHKGREGDDLIRSKQEKEAILNNIDIVVMWVDGNDPNWLKEKAKYIKSDVDNDSANIANRFRDWGLMKYWFRALEQYAPWVRKVHFVTWGHVPDFLDISHEKLHIVNHKDFMPVGSLPTYSSKALEMNLWRIEDLSERFLLFNDDVFFCDYTRAEDFFDPSTGLPKMVFQEIPLRFKGIEKDWQITSSQCLGLINQHIPKKKIKLTSYIGKQLSFKYPISYNVRSLFSKLLFPEYYVGFKVFHAEGAFLKSTFQNLWLVEQPYIASVSKHKLRNLTDINQWAAQYWQLASGKFIPKKLESEYFEVSAKSINAICKTIQSRSKKTICINDADTLSDYEPLAEKIKATYESVLPVKSSFEK